MSIDYQVFTDVHSVAMAGNAIEGVKSVRLTRTAAEIHASGDDDIYESTSRAAAQSIKGEIVLADLAQAAALAGVVGTLSFVWRDGRGQTDKTVTVASVSITAIGATASHGRASEAKVGFIAESADGLTDPVTMSQE